MGSVENDDGGEVEDAVEGEDGKQAKRSLRVRIMFGSRVDSK